MKKYLIWIGAAVLVMALASPSMAQFKTWGHLEVESYWMSNKSLNKDLVDANYQGIAMRYRFNLGYGDPKTVMAVLGFEANSRGFGETPEGSPTVTGVGPSAGTVGTTGAPVAGNAGSVSLAGRNTVGGWGTDQIGLQVRHAYFDFTIPNTPLTMQVGIQNQAIGGFLGRFFFNKDVPGFILNANFAPHTLSAFWWKGVKQNYFSDNDLDYYGLLYRLKQQMFNVEAWFVYGNDRRSATDSWTLTRTTVGNVSTYAITETLTPRLYEQKPWWLGANVPITFGNWKFEPIFAYLGGKAQDSAAGGSGLSNRDFSAYMGDLQVSYRLGPGLKFLVEGYYASGNDGNKNPTLGTAGVSDTISAWMTPGVGTDGTENRNVFGNGWSVFYFSNTELSYYGTRQLTQAGHAFIRPNAEFNPFPWLNLNFNYLYIMNTANKYNAHINFLPAAAGPTGTDVNKSYIGSEANVIAKIAIYKDFQYAVGYGYFWPGDVFDTPSKTADAAWSLLTNLRYVF